MCTATTDLNNETNVTHVLLRLLGIKGPIHFSSIACSSSGDGAQTTIGILRVVMSVGCTRIGLVQPSDITRTNIQSVVCVVPPEDEQVTLKTSKGPQFLIN
jgi:hypothetical protein